MPKELAACSSKSHLSSLVESLSLPLFTCTQFFSLSFHWCPIYKVDVVIIRLAYLWIYIMWMRMYLCTYIYVYIYIYIYTYIYFNIYVCTYWRMCICVSVCECLYVYLQMCLFISIFFRYLFLTVFSCCNICVDFATAFMFWSSFCFIGEWKFQEFSRIFWHHELCRSSH